MTGANPGREDLERWRRSQGANLYLADPNLGRVLERRAGAPRLGRMVHRLEGFGAEMVGVVEPAVEALERHRELPAHTAYDPVGRRTEAVEFDPAYERVGRAVWSSGMLSASHEGEGPFELAALFYLLSHSGEGGHACPVVCTVGLERALEHRGSPELKARYLPSLRSSSYERCLRGAQFLTEVQGGSDVGANLVEAAPDPENPGAWRITGEKWFCSVADADLFAVTARPVGAEPGTRGLGCFLVPRSVDQTTPNGFSIRRLKDKLGTRAMASAEIDFEAALGWPIGPVAEGFHVAVEELLDTSRWLNAVGSTGIMRRAYLEASSFARHRRAFKEKVVSFPAVQEILAIMKAEEFAALSSTMALTGLVDRRETGTASPVDEAAYRFLVNANKYITSITATDVVHRAIEVLGGNGTIEDFSPLPRLYRDSVVFESWEGTHNVLCAQVYRDFLRLDLLGPVLRFVREELASAGESAGSDGDAVAQALEGLQARLQRSLSDPDHGAAHFRRQLADLARASQAACLLAEASREDSEKPAVASLFVRRHLSPRHDPESDPAWRQLVAGALEGDVAP